MRPLVALAFVFAGCAAAQAPDFTTLVRDASPSVVNLTGVLRPVLPDLPLAEDEESDPGLMRDFLRRYFGPDGPEVRSLGSGFVIDAAGYVMTNAHLVQSGEEITVRLADRREFDARVVGSD